MFFHVGIDNGKAGVISSIVNSLKTNKITIIAETNANFGQRPTGEINSGKVK